MNSFTRNKLISKRRGKKLDVLKNIQKWNRKKCYSIRTRITDSKKPTSCIQNFISSFKGRCWKFF